MIVVGGTGGLLPGFLSLYLAWRQVPHLSEYLQTRASHSSGEQPLVDCHIPVASEFAADFAISADKAKAERQVQTV